MRCVLPITGIVPCGCPQVCLSAAPSTVQCHWIEWEARLQQQQCGTMQEVRLDTQPHTAQGCGAHEVRQEPRTWGWDNPTGLMDWASGSSHLWTGGRWCTQGAAGFSALETLSEPVLLTQAVPACPKGGAGPSPCSEEKPRLGGS